MKIIIDSGHDGVNTIGKRNPPLKQKVDNKFMSRRIKLPVGYQLMEHCANTGIAEYLEQELKKRGHKVYKLGWTKANAWRKDECPSDPSEDVIERQQVAKKMNADVCISIHNDAIGDGENFNDANGISVLYHSVMKKVGDGEEFARIVYKHVSKAIPKQKGRGTLAGSGWGMCNSTSLNVKASCIVECCFMTNEKECMEIFMNPEAWYKIAVKLADAMDEYARMRGL